MTKTLNIGAPSLTGKDANAEIKAAFEAAEFPLTLVLTSCAGFNVSLPEADMLLRPGASAEASFASFDRLQRAASSLSQLAELNRLECIVSVTARTGAAEKPAAKPSDADQAAEKPAITRKK